MNLQKVKALSDDELRIKVALLTGEWQEGLGDGWNGVIGRIDGREYIRCSNYPRDLNACHEMEATLGCPRHWEYERLLKQITGRFWWHATARQRCEAFVTVMEGGE